MKTFIATLQPKKIHPHLQKLDIPSRVSFQVKPDSKQGVITTAAKKALQLDGWKTKTVPHGESTYKILDNSGNILAFVEAQ